MGERVDALVSIENKSIDTMVFPYFNAELHKGNFFINVLDLDGNLLTPVYEYTNVSFFAMQNFVLKPGEKRSQFLPIAFWFGNNTDVKESLYSFYRNPFEFAFFNPGKYSIQITYNDLNSGEKFATERILFKVEKPSGTNKEISDEVKSIIDKTERLNHNQYCDELVKVIQKYENEEMLRLVFEQLLRSYSLLNYETDKSEPYIYHVTEMLKRFPNSYLTVDALMNPILTKSEFFSTPEVQELIDSIYIYNDVRFLFKEYGIY